MQTLKHIKIAAIALFLALSVVSCSTHVHTTGPTKTKKVPPGQAKKMSGSKSAKAYAPGQQKKN